MASVLCAQEHHHRIVTGHSVNYARLAIECYRCKMVYNYEKCTMIDTMISTVISTNIHMCTKIIPILYCEHAIELGNCNFDFLSLEYSNHDLRHYNTMEDCKFTERPIWNRSVLIRTVLKNH